MELNQMDKDFEEKLQSVQDCRNSLNACGVPEELDRKTIPAVNPNEKQDKKHKPMAKDTRDHLDNKLSELLTKTNESFASLKQNGNEQDNEKSIDEIDNSFARSVGANGKSRQIN